jgi:hypothetical protein
MHNILLVGGRKRREVTSVTPKGVLGGRYEGRVDRVMVTVRKNGRERKVLMAEKMFDPRTAEFEKEVIGQPNIRDPQKQFETIQEIKALNAKHKLNLPILPTVRLRIMHNGEKRLLLTHLKNVVDPFIGSGLWKTVRTKNGSSSRRVFDPNASEKEFLEWQRINLEKARIRKVLKQHGFYMTAHDDVWLYTMNPRTKKLKVWIGDFGNLTKGMHVQEWHYA